MSSSTFADIATRIEELRGQASQLLRAPGEERRQAHREIGGALDALQEALEELRAAEATQRFLADASRVLATSLDHRQTLSTLARLAVPRVADYCLIHEVEESGKVRQVAAAHADAECEALLRELAHLRFPDPDDPDSIVAQVLRTGKPSVHPVVPADLTAAVHAEPRVIEILRALAPTSLMVLPLRARNQTVGAISLGRTHHSAAWAHRYGESDLVLAEELAARGGLAIDNARLYERAERASQAKSDFLAIMSHELRTPLTAIIGYAEILGDEIVGTVNPVQKEQLGRIQASGAHLLELVEEILTFARVEAGQERVYRETVELATLVDAARTLIAPLVTRKGLDFRVKVPPSPVRVETDPGKVRQILLNLLGNAVKFTERGEIGIEAHAAEGCAVFEVWDTGIGIPREHRERIFEPFWQVEAAATRRAGGTGLGLSVVRQLARLLGGDVTLESEPGQGSRFCVTIRGIVR